MRIAGESDLVKRDRKSWKLNVQSRGNVCRKSGQGAAVCMRSVLEQWAMMMLRIKGAALKSKGSWTLENARQGDVYFDGLHDCT